MTWKMQLTYPTNPKGEWEEHAYGETVAVKDGVCYTSNPLTKQHLEGCMYAVVDEIPDGEDGDAASVPDPSEGDAPNRRPRVATVSG